MSDPLIVFNPSFPETQVCALYHTYTSLVVGTVRVTSGFMEPHGHGYRKDRLLGIIRVWFGFCFSMSAL